MTKPTTFTHFVSVCFSLPNNSHDGDDDHQFRMPQMRHRREIWQKQLLRSRRFLVQKLRKCW